MIKPSLTGAVCCTKRAGLTAKAGCPWKVPNSFWPTVIDPAGLAAIAGACVATGTAVGAGPDDTPVGLGALGALVGLGALGAEVADGPVAAASGVAVADEPQATKNKSAVINDANKTKPGFLKLCNMISEPPEFKTTRIPRSPSRITNRMGPIKIAYVFLLKIEFSLYVLMIISRKSYL